MFGGVEARTANVVPVATDSARRGPPGSPEGREGGFKRSSRAHTHHSDFMGAAGAGGGCEALLGLKLVEWPSRASLRAGLTARACSESVRARSDCRNPRTAADRLGGTAAPVCQTRLAGWARFAARCCYSEPWASPACSKMPLRVPSRERVAPERPEAVEIVDMCLLCLGRIFGREGQCFLLNRRSVVVVGATLVRRDHGVRECRD